MKNIVLLSILFCSLVSYSQTIPTIDENPAASDIAETEPEFPGGQRKMQEFIVKNIKYPALAVENKLSGTVYVRFKVNKLGELSDINVVRGKHEVLNKEAIRVVQLMPNWTPGTQLGKPVSVIFTLPINFRLN